MYIFVGVKFVAIDFDLTLVDLNTAERNANLDAGSITVRPFFREFVPLALESDLLIGIVTFSKYVDMIGAVLRLSFGTEIANRIVIRGNDSTWEYKGVCF